MRRGEASQESSPRDVHSVENAYDRSERRGAWCIGVLMPCGTPAAFVGGARRVTSGLPTIREFRRLVKLRPQASGLLDACASAKQGYASTSSEEVVLSSQNGPSVFGLRPLVCP